MKLRVIYMLSLSELEKRLKEPCRPCFCGAQHILHCLNRQSFCWVNFLEFIYKDGYYGVLDPAFVESGDMERLKPVAEWIIQRSYKKNQLLKPMSFSHR